ncbi:MAG: RNB domain-containing ribonuclease [Anaerolineae bacterium]
MSETHIPENSLVLYKARPARVRQAGEKLILELEDGTTIKVRPKDVSLLHPGPITNLTAVLTPPPGDPHTAWEILAGTHTTLMELAELAFGAFTPAAAWAAWQLAAQGVHFRWTADGIAASSPEEVAAIQAARAVSQAEKQAWEAFLGRARAGKVAPEDRRYLQDVEDLALGRTTRSRVLRALGREESPENAHATLLELGAWDETVNPYPVRFNLTLSPPALALPAGWDVAAVLQESSRLDLTHLAAYAIDDAGTDTPDDALSFEPGPGLGRVWVHVADAAVLITPAGALDLEARSRGTSLYLPEAQVPMLPPQAIPLLGLGLAEISPALSLGFTVEPDGRLSDLTITPSRVRVTRLTYEAAEEQMDQAPFRQLMAACLAYQARRQGQGAVNIELPEVSVRVREGDPIIRPIPALRSRGLVENAMIMAGEAAALFAQAQGIAIPYATQEPPDAPTWTPAQSLAEMYALRRIMKRSQYRSLAAPHSGLGLAAYVQVTSPLRRYLDLVAHQQLRASLTGMPLLGTEDIIQRIGEVEPALAAARQAEQLSIRHWILVYLMRHPGWRGRGVLVDRRGSSGVFIIPELGLEAQMHLAEELPLDSEVTLVLRSVDLARQDARFRVETGRGI